MCSLKELQDGTYTIKDLEIMHQIIELKGDIEYIPPVQDTQPQTLYG